MAATATETAFSDDPGELWRETQQRLDAGDPGTAITLLQQLRAAHPDYRSEEVGNRLNELCRFWYAETASIGDPAVEDAIQCIARLNPSDPLVQELTLWEDYFQAQAQLESGESAAAITTLESLGDDAPAGFAGGRHLILLYDAYIQEGDSACAQTRYDAARDWYLKGRQLDPVRLEAVSHLAECKPPTDTPTVAPTATITPTPLPPGFMTAIYNQDGLFNLRAGPGFNYPIVGRVEAGATFNVHSRSEDSRWLSATTQDGKEVWVLAELVESNYPAVAAAVKTTPIPPAEFTAADSVADFGPEQGTKFWIYGASKTPGNLEFERMPWDASSGKWYRWPNTAGRDPNMRLSDAGGYPSMQSDVVRVWVNFFEGKARVDGWVAKEPGAGQGGNGVSLRIIHHRPEGDGQTGFDNEIWSGSLGPYDTAGYAISGLPLLDLKQRDQIYFVTSANGNDEGDNTIFRATITLLNEGGAVYTPTPTVPPTPTSTAVPPPPTLCFEPRLRHYERSTGGQGEAVGYVYTSGGRLTRGAIRVKGPAGGNQWVHDFPLTGDGGYEATLLKIYGPPPFKYTAELVGTRVRSIAVFDLTYPEAQARRAVVDWYQVSCK